MPPKRKNSSSLNEKEWVPAKLHSYESGYGIDILQHKKEKCYKLNVVSLVKTLIRSERIRSKAIEAIKNWFDVLGTGALIDETYCDSKYLGDILELLVDDTNLINREAADDLWSDWLSHKENLDEEYPSWIEEDEEEGVYLEIESSDGEPAFTQEQIEEWTNFAKKRKRDNKGKEEEDDEYIDDDDDDEISSSENVVIGVQEEEEESKESKESLLSFQERVELLKLYSSILKSATGASTYLHLRIEENVYRAIEYNRTLEDSDALIRNIINEIRKLTPIHNKEALKLYSPDLVDSNKTDSAIRTAQRIKHLGYGSSWDSMIHSEQISALKQIGLEASNLHLEKYGRKPQKLRLPVGMGSGSSRYINYYNEETAKYTLDVAIQNYFNFQDN